MLCLRLLCRMDLRMDREALPSVTSRSSATQDVCPTRVTLRLS
eukprot:CAMPEP_0177413858 /NCGR_PEP_ID=MMETSP0368-20130122/66750_1 /TAXON_ID=447022 ORGANISM="Scrippsiella hangoei-like, Strain SHHI-4" /NCGR_SAMPLE_ID=MMETSP0368 /ASSEMBLY_ACC=CAM_ASM_000363 /LENGTH=42 /DNA_ID= /DNA_START= /DNA_END= /DNA_ORIENTATION=